MSRPAVPSRPAVGAGDPRRDGAPARPLAGLLAGLFGGELPISPYQFAAFRLVFGLYLAVHLAALLPYGGELFSRRGVLPDPALNLTHGLFPNPLAVWDSPAAVAVFLGLATAAAIAFALGAGRKVAAVVLWFGWTALFHRNNLIANPGLPYVGLLLVATLLVPAGEPLALGRRRREGPAAAGWSFPAPVYWTVWLAMAAGYSYSGWVKLASPSWLDGTALAHVATNPLARPGPLRDALLAAPAPVLAALTWGALATELLALPLSFHRRTRLVSWLSLVGLHLGILTVVDFADLTLGMLMVHLFTFDPRWLPARRRRGARQLVLYDGVCGLCDRAVQFLVAEDRAGALSFAPLQGEAAAAVRRRHRVADDLASMVFVRDHGGAGERVFTRSSAVLGALSAMGGFWRLVSWGRAVPRPLRDALYDFVARRRYGWFGRLDACRLPSAETRVRFLD